jgi:hypothetical protein
MIADDVLSRIQKLKQQHSQAATELWNTRLELLQEAGDFRAIVDHLRTPVELAGDNCSCNSACRAPVFSMGQRE